MSLTHRFFQKDIHQIFKGYPESKTGRWDSPRCLTELGKLGYVYNFDQSKDTGNAAPEADQIDFAIDVFCRAALMHKRTQKETVTERELIRQNLPGRVVEINGDEVVIEFETPEGFITEEVFSKNQFENPDLLTHGAAVKATNRLVTDPSRDELSKGDLARLEALFDEDDELENRVKDKPTVKVRT